MAAETDEYKHCNHHHELTDEHEIVELGGCEFVANKAAIPLLKALNDAGLKTRSHHYVGPDEGGFVCLMMDNIEISIANVTEDHSSRDHCNGQQLVISWQPKQTKLSRARLGTKAE